MAEAPAHRATLLIGYGQFGLDVLRRFLASTATRGVLAWENSVGPDNNARRLRDLGLLCLRDVFEGGPWSGDGQSLEGSHIELMRDLYQQIEIIDADASHAVERAQQALEEAVLAKASLLLDASVRAMREEVLPLGLDVIVLARPHQPAVVGRLTELLQAGMDRLERFATQLQRPVAGAGALNFVQILDFDNYWQRSPDGQPLREALHRAVERWQQRRAEGRAAFGRIYLVDGHNADGVHDERQRIDEISLFLEFLLFEGQRGGELQGLYQAQALQEPLVASFGIRLLERSAGLLRRLAAAQFGIHWLDYLAGQQAAPGNEARELRRALDAYRADALDTLLEADSLNRSLERRLDELAQALAALPVDSSDWPEQVQTCHTQAARRLEAEWAAQARQHIQQLLSREPLADLHKTLREKIDAALHDERQPAPLGAVLREVGTVLAELDRATAKPADLAETRTAPPFGRLRQDWQRYRHFQSLQLDAGAAQKWWPLFGFLLAAGISPVLADWFANLPEPDKITASVLVRQSHAITQWLAGHAAALLAGLGLLFWGLLAAVGQPALRGRVERARQFWADPERGRLAGRLRALMQPDGELGGALAAFLRHRLADMAFSIRSEVGRELGQISQRLAERRRELAWLRGQLREFLILHGLNPEAPGNTWSRMDHERTGIRFAMEHYQDFERILQTNPPTADRFLSMQAVRQPFRHWDGRYSDAFLYPLRFIDELSAHYGDPFEEELARPGIGDEQSARARQLRDFLERRGDFPLAFSWRAQEGVPIDRLYCLLPNSWLALPGIAEQLAGLGIRDAHRLPGTDAARAYLLRVKTGVDAACLK